MLTLLKKNKNNAISPLFLNPFSALGYLERREDPGALVWSFSFHVTSILDYFIFVICIGVIKILSVSCAITKK